MQELESRVALYDLMNHGDKSITLYHTAGPNGEVPEHHWFSLIRRFVRSLSFSSFPLLSPLSPITLPYPPPPLLIPSSAIFTELTECYF